MRRKVVLPLILASLFLAACVILIYNAINATADPDELINAYLSIIDTLYNEDTALNSGIKYVAVDTSAMTNLDRAAKDKLLKAVEKYNCIVLEDGFDGLEAKGYIKDVWFQEGILFILKDKPPSNGVITIVTDKWRNGVGSIRYTFDLKKSDGDWKIDKKYDFLIS